MVPQEWVDAGDRVATRLRHHGRGRESGLEIDAELYHQVVTFRDGTIVRIEYFASWDEALAAAGARRRASSSDLGVLACAAAAAVAAALRR